MVSAHKSTTYFLSEIHAQHNFNFHKLSFNFKYSFQLEQKYCLNTYFKFSFFKAEVERKKFLKQV